MVHNSKQEKKYNCYKCKKDFIGNVAGHPRYCDDCRKQVYKEERKRWDINNKEYKSVRAKEWRRRNKNKLPMYKKKYRKYNKLKVNLRNKTRANFKIPINQKCQFCDNLAIARHHYTIPYEFDKFWFVCRECHRIKDLELKGVKNDFLER